MKARAEGDVLKRYVTLDPSTKVLTEVGLLDKKAKTWFKRFTVYGNEVLQLQLKSPIVVTAAKVEVVE